MSPCPLGPCQVLTMILHLCTKGLFLSWGHCPLPALFLPRKWFLVRQGIGNQLPLNFQCRTKATVSCLFCRTPDFLKVNGCVRSKRLLGTILESNRILRGYTSATILLSILTWFKVWDCPVPVLGRWAVVQPKAILADMDLGKVRVERRLFTQSDMWMHLGKDLCLSSCWRENIVFPLCMCWELPWLMERDFCKTGLKPAFLYLSESVSVGSMFESCWWDTIPDTVGLVNPQPCSCNCNYFLIVGELV